MAGAAANDRDADASSIQHVGDYGVTAADLGQRP